MLDRIVGQIALALFDWLDKRIDRRTEGVDASPDPAVLRRAAARIREWLRGQ
jgi:hypothetical protein